MTESKRWDALIVHLQWSLCTGLLTSAQWVTFNKVCTDDLLRPAVGIAEGILQLSWAYDFIPGRTFTVEILHDGSVEWFFRSEARDICIGTEGHSVSALPPEALEYLRSTFYAIAHRSWWRRVFKRILPYKKDEAKDEG